MLDHPLRLAVGSHQAGSGKGCAMNVISWENGDTTVTDMPACADPVLARIVQRVNDTIRDHRDGDLLCPDCSIKVLELAHRTVGTGGEYTLDRHRVWVRVAADQARAVLHLARDRAVAERAILAAEAWADDPSDENRASAADASASYAASAADASASYAASAASAAASYADAASYAASAADASASYAASAASADAAADAAASAADAAADAAANLLELAHRAIDLFLRLTGIAEHQPTPERTERAYAAMTASS